MQSQKSLTINLKSTAANRNAVQAFYQAKNAVAEGNVSLVSQYLTERVIEQIIDFSRTNPAAIALLAETGDILSRAKSFESAEKIYRSILEIRDDIAAYNILAFILMETGRPSEAESSVRKAYSLYPQRIDVAVNLANILLQKGNLAECGKLLQQAFNTNIEDARTYSSCLFLLHYLEDIDRENIFEAHRKYAQLYAPPENQHNRYPNTIAPDRKLKIGYISPDFGGHSVTWFFMPILKAHNRDKFEIYGYGNIRSPDKITEQFKPMFDFYRDIYGLEADNVSELIKDDAIDILVDLAGHTGGNSISVLALKPAPVQVTYLGYPDTTGLPQVDYRLTDKFAETQDAAKYYSEKLFYLDKGFLCYCPPIPRPDVGPLPAIKNGFITFASFNMNKKINPFTIKLWSDVMKNCKNSKLILKFRSASDPAVKEHYFKEFEKAGLPGDRIEIYDWLSSQQQHLDLYNQVDIALDTYPYHGTTTTCEALLMGVPVISLTGEHHMSRVGLSILTRLGLEFFAASTPDEYVSKATVLAAKPDALAKIRAQVRARMAASTLCNRDLFTKNIEQAYRTMWYKWCKSKGVDVPSEELRPDAQRLSADTAACSSKSTQATTNPLGET